jgi:hypothetical protein
MGSKKTRKPWSPLADITPFTRDEFRDWLGKVIAGWREIVEPGPDENLKRARERSADLRNCFKAVVLHGDRLGIPRVLAEYHDWLDPLYPLTADSPGRVLRDLRLIDGIVSAPPPATDQATGNAGSTPTAAKTNEGEGNGNRDTMKERGSPRKVRLGAVL